MSESHQQRGRITLYLTQAQNELIKKWVEKFQCSSILHFTAYCAMRMIDVCFQEFEDGSTLALCDGDVVVHTLTIEHLLARVFLDGQPQDFAYSPKQGENRYVCSASFTEKQTKIVAELIRKNGFADENQLMHAALVWFHLLLVHYEREVPIKLRVTRKDGQVFEVPSLADLKAVQIS